MSSWRLWVTLAFVVAAVLLGIWATPLSGWIGIALRGAAVGLLLAALVLGISAGGNEEPTPFAGAAESGCPRCQRPFDECVCTFSDSDVLRETMADCPCGWVERFTGPMSERMSKARAALQGHAQTCWEERDYWASYLKAHGLKFLGRRPA